MQFVGRHFEEGLMLNTAHQYQKRTNWHELSPEKFGGQG